MAFDRCEAFSSISFCVLGTFDDCCAFGLDLTDELLVSHYMNYLRYPFDKWIIRKNVYERKQKCLFERNILYPKGQQVYLRDR